MKNELLKLFNIFSSYGEKIGIIIVENRTKKENGTYQHF